MTNILVTDRKWVRVGRRIALATPECRASCCNGCPSWRLLAVCDTSPRCDGSPPPVLSAWICTSVTCLDGSPIGIGQRIAVDGLCWTAQIQTQPVPPPDSYIIEGLEPVQCVDDCYDEACPQPNIWYRGIPCNPANPEMWFCGITECGIYNDGRGCYKVDPSMGGGPLPPGALYANGGTIYTNCCTCESGCRVCPLVGGAIIDADCYPLEITNQTCCRSDRACIRLLRYRGTQTSVVGGNVVLVITNEAVNPVSNPDGSVTWRIRQTFAITGQPPQVQLLPDPVQLTYLCGMCPSWDLRATRLYQDTSFVRDGTWTEECHGYPDGGDGQVVTVSGWGNNSWTCDRMVQDVTYTYTNSFVQSFITRFEFEAIIEDDDGGVCAGRCLGRGVSAQRRAATGAGCSGCGSGAGLVRVL